MLAHHGVILVPITRTLGRSPLKPNDIAIKLSTNEFIIDPLPCLRSVLIFILLTTKSAVHSSSADNLKSHFIEKHCRSRARPE